MAERKHWEWEINNSSSYWGASLAELWAYRHLLASLVRKNFLVNYQQTILGPAWMFLQPILTLATYTLIFGRLVGLSTGTLPPVLFYFSGIILWNFFNECFGGTANTFRENAQVFSKVYFPRIITPLSIFCTQFIRLFIQLFLLFLLYCYYILFRDFIPRLDTWFFVFPVALLAVGSIGMGLGLTLSVITAKYRDLSGFVQLGIRLLMFGTPVIYPLTYLAPDMRWIIQLNPLTSLFELFRFSLYGEGVVIFPFLAYSLFFAALLLAIGLLLFNKKGDSIIDIV
ncbi:ABC transporter permease [Pontibacter vulgaris]|uniref:ABC transporter permease n=1 Tax=Pontibacter vulgaris TaxID=2905679 RepID=UPI001FA79380|nr:ABC transporter permease [Pontibacter vulgaris]